MMTLIFSRLPRSFPGWSSDGLTKSRQAHGLPPLAHVSSSRPSASGSLRWVSVECSGTDRTCSLSSGLGTSDGWLGINLVNRFCALSTKRTSEQRISRSHRGDVRMLQQPAEWRGIVVTTARRSKLHGRHSDRTLSRARCASGASSTRSGSRVPGCEWHWLTSSAPGCAGAGEVEVSVEKQRPSLVAADRRSCEPTGKIECGVRSSGNSRLPALDDLITAARLPALVACSGLR